MSTTIKDIRELGHHQAPPGPLIATIIETKPIRTGTRNDGTPWSCLNFTVQDASGKCRVVWWNPPEGAASGQLIGRQVKITPTRSGSYDLVRAEIGEYKNKPTFQLAVQSEALQIGRAATASAGGGGGGGASAGGARVPLSTWIQTMRYTTTKASQILTQFSSDPPSAESISAIVNTTLIALSHGYIEIDLEGDSVWESYGTPADTGSGNGDSNGGGGFADDDDIPF